MHVHSFHNVSLNTFLPIRPFMNLLEYTPKHRILGDSWSFCLSGFTGACRSERHVGSGGRKNRDPGRRPPPVRMLGFLYVKNSSAFRGTASLSLLPVRIKGAEVKLKISCWLKVKIQIFLPSGRHKCAGLKESTIRLEIRLSSRTSYGQS